MKLGTLSIIPACQIKYGLWTWSPVTRMIQSDAGLRRFRKYRCPSMLTRSKSDVLFPSSGLTDSREDALVRNSVTGLAVICRSSSIAHPESVGPGDGG